ncbi:MAG: hypothetical protein JW993_07360 [Sedimentisphaerales bacterium]|nr:hypothetical protein [Sedimentisphaerales bacterium]
MWSAIKRMPNSALFFILAFLYLWLVTEPRLTYYAFGTIVDACPFATGWSFLRDSLAAPGGLVVYVSGLLSQGYYHSWLGVLIIVLVGLGLAELARRHFVRAGCKGREVLSMLPAIAFFTLCASYKHPLTACLAVSMGLFLSLVFETAAPTRVVMRVVLYLFMAALVFWLAAGGGLLVFVLMTILYAAFVRRDAWLAVLAAPAGVGIVWALARHVFLVAPQQALLVLTPFSDPLTGALTPFQKSLVILLYGFVPFTAALTLLLTRWPVLKKRAATTRKKHDRARMPLPAILRKAVVIGVPVAVLAISLGASHEKTGKAFVLSNYYCRERQWDRILELGRELPKGQSNIYVNHDIIRALYHTGRLPYDMFEFPQVPPALLLTHEGDESDLTQSRLCDLFLELGHVNVAERLASELLAVRGRFGHVLERLSWIAIIKGQEQAARAYLNALSENPVYHGTAESLLDGLDHGFAPDQVTHIDRIRSYMPTDSDTVTGDSSVEELLTALLERNPGNRMAFEYLMACYLLTGQVDKVVANLERLDRLGYRTIPTLYEEAILLYHGVQGRKLDVSKFNVSPETLRRYVTFVQIHNSMQSQNRSAVLNRLVRDFGTSYFFYFTFGRVGLS